MNHEGWSWERTMKAAEDEPSAPGNTGTRGLQIVSESNSVSYGRHTYGFATHRRQSVAKGGIETRPRYTLG